MLGPAVVGIGLALGSNFDLLSLVLLPCCFAGSVFITFHMLQNYEWVELDGELIRGRRFWTRELVEHRIDHITEIVPLGAAIKDVKSKITDYFIGSVRGYAIHFKDTHQTIGLIRHDMANVDALIAALVVRKQQDSQ